jgi:aminoglycoside phosphotransferase (APT) family kinase protein
MTRVPSVLHWPAPVADRAEVRLERIASFLTGQLPQVRPPLRFTRLAGGNSNLTYRVQDTSGASWVLRRPPVGSALATAHDVLREARVLRALAASPVPVPRVLLTCEHEAVDPAPFVLMEYVEGLACAGAADAASLTAVQRHAVGLRMARTLADLHRVNPDAVGLGDLGRREGYVQRQLARWHTQWHADRQRPLPALQAAYDRLLARVPAQRRVALVHGDFRLDNCIIGDDAAVHAVLDWEICALGDPLADLGVLLAYWAEPGDELCALQDPPTLAGGFPSRADLLSVYLDATGRDPGEDVDYFVAFAWWKLACIVEGVYSRATRTPPASGRTAQSYADQAARLADHAAELVAAL